MQEKTFQADIITVGNVQVPGRETVLRCRLGTITIRKTTWLQNRMKSVPVAK